MKVAVIGTQGVPASYGGFESLVENLLGANCPEDVEYTVFCSKKDMDPSLSEYKGARLRYVPLHANGAQSMPYDMLSLCKAAHGYDVVLVLGVSGCLFMPVFVRITRSKIIVNIDGLEHRRDKWSRFAKWILRHSEAMAVRYADAVVADNKGIQDYVSETYGRPSELIAYGGDHVRKKLSEEFCRSTLRRYGLERGNYAITVCRIEPENNSHHILEAFSHTDHPLIFIGNWNHSDWSRQLKERYQDFPNIRLVDAVYDLDILYALRSNAGIYVHGHSAGGTNPSLVEAMFFGIPIIAFDCVYNRETTFGRASYFKEENELRMLLDRDDLDGAEMRELAKSHYTWSHIAGQYVDLYRRLRNKR